MTDELLITETPYGIRAAVVSDGAPVAFFVEPATRRSRVGDLHLARPLRVLPGIDACFVDIGDGEEAFLRGAEIAKPGVPFIVQVASDAREEKLARVTDLPVLASRLVVFRPGGAEHAFSRRIRNPHRLHALKQAVGEAETPGGAVTVRTTAADAPPERVGAIAGMLATRWRSLEASAARDQTPRRLWDAGGLLGRLLRDVAPSGIARIVTDGPQLLDRALGVVGTEAPEIAASLTPHDDGSGARPGGPYLPLFERHDCAGRFAAALEPVATLPSGARLTIEETRALAAIDVDTAGAVGDAPETILVDTAEAVGREIRLRDLGGLIAIDFPGGGGSARARAAQISALKRALAPDCTPNRVLGATAGGLVEVNRRRLGPSLLEALTEPAGSALGGRVPRLEAAAHDLAHAAQREVASGARRLTVRAAPALLEALAEPGGDALDRWLGAVLTRVPDPSLPRGRFALERA
ncbi:MAG: ribonuclease E/G [Sphingomonadales bacterium]|nr:ribonuclease E/G [Sphingomonadales bacterium]